ncbi:MAG: type II toxin-antitoxin system HicB family antitoxin [Phormidesmis sp.]
MRYPVVIYKDIDSDYGVTVPDLPGCFSAGTSIDEALEEAVEAIECHVEGLLIDNEGIPLPIAIERHKENPDFADGIWALVDIDLSKLSGKTRRINVTIPERILKRIDDCASRQGESRSGFMTTAAIEYMAAVTDAGEALC